MDYSQDLFPTPRDSQANTSMYSRKRGATAPAYSYVKRRRVMRHPGWFARPLRRYGFFSETNPARFQKRYRVTNASDANQLLRVKGFRTVDDTVNGGAATQVITGADLKTLFTDEFKQYASFRVSALKTEYWCKAELVKNEATEAVYPTMIYTPLSTPDKLSNVNTKEKMMKCADAKHIIVYPTKKVNFYTRKPAWRYVSTSDGIDIVANYGNRGSGTWIRTNFDSPDTTAKYEWFNNQTYTEANDAANLYYNMIVWVEFKDKIQ